ncbi:hypothetical protein Dimus_035329, partial [Dionaea muscipula]
MGRRKKKKIPLIPISQWTPIVQGLNTDDSDSSSEAADLDSAPLMEPIDEENELNSEDVSCPSSNNASAMPDATIDDATADGKDCSPLQNTPPEIHLMNPNSSNSSMDEMGDALDAAIEEIRANPDKPLLEDLRCPIPVNPSDSGLNPTQSSELLVDSRKTDNEGQQARQARMNSSSSSPQHASPALEGPHPSKDDNYKGQWSQLFANNPLKTNLHIWRPKLRPRKTAWKRVPTTANSSRDNPSNQVIHNSLDNEANVGPNNPGCQEPMANTSSVTVHDSNTSDPSCSTHASLTMTTSRTVHDDTAAGHPMPAQPAPLNPTPSCALEGFTQI